MPAIFLGSRVDHLAMENVPVPTDFVVSTDDVLGVETSAGVDLHRKHLPPTIIRQ